MRAGRAPCRSAGRCRSQPQPARSPPPEAVPARSSWWPPKSVVCRFATSRRQRPPPSSFSTGRLPDVAWTNAGNPPLVGADASDQIAVRRARRRADCVRERCWPGHHVPARDRPEDGVERIDGHRLRRPCRAGRRDAATTTTAGRHGSGSCAASPSRLRALEIDHPRLELGQPRLQGHDRFLQHGDPRLPGRDRCLQRRDLFLKPRNARRQRVELTGLRRPAAPPSSRARSPPARPASELRHR